jgi:flagellar biosynthesis chaperone FliJ
MIKCLFADITSISSQIARTEFDESEIEHLADVILATDGLIRPLIVKQVGLEQYTVIEGNLEYYAAVRAKEKDSRRAEMVNAFVIPADRQQLAIEQLALLSRTKSNPISNSINVNISIEQLTSIIAQQLQPLQQQLVNVGSELAEHKKILNSFKSEWIEDREDLQPKIVNVDLNTLVTPAQIIDLQQIDTAPKIEPIAKIIKPKPESTTATKPEDKSKATKTPARSKAAKSDKIEPIDQPLEPKIVATPAATKSTVAKQAKSTTKSKVGLDPSIDPIKAANTLDLINTLSAADLVAKMERSGIPAGARKFVSVIIDKRNTQPAQKFASWEIVMSAVPGLKSATAANIINKLK